MYIVCMIGLVFFAMIGLCAFVSAIVGIWTDRNDENDYLIVIQRPNADNAEYRLRAAIRKINEIGKGEILCLCEENDPETMSICRRMEQDCPCLKIVDQKGLRNRLGIE